MSETGIRLNKFISDSGFCSRREADAFIEAKQVRVNGKLADLGVRVVDGDHIKVKGKLLPNRPATVYLAYHKPVGVTCTTDPQDPSNIVDAVKYSQRIFPIGRLDKDSEGLILLTNDGDIVNKILRAGNAHDKEYVVRVDKAINGEFLRQMSQGVPILGTRTLPCQLRQLDNHEFVIILQQGLNRQIRRMCEYFGYQVQRLKRTRIMHLKLSGLKPGQWRLLSSQEIKTLQQAIASSQKTADASSAKAVRKTTNKDSNKPFKAKPDASKGRSDQAGKNPGGKQNGKQNGKHRAPKPSSSGGYKGKPSNRRTK